MILAELMTEKAVLNIGNLKVARGDVKLVIYALGSCVCICLYDKTTKTGGMAHVLLPSSKEANKDSVAGEPGKYADSALDELLLRMKNSGADVGNIKAKVFGGARMFAMGTPLLDYDIGRMNIDAVMTGLSERAIPIDESDVGGTFARTVVFDLNDGSVTIKHR